MTVIRGKNNVYKKVTKWVATAKRHRGKGVCAALMAHTHLYLRDNGYSLAILVPSDPSLFDFYRKQGYETCGYISDFKVQAEDREIHLKKFSATEYFNIRNTFTPQNSVNLIGYTDFLNSQYAFYKGDDFIFCKNKSGSSFPEFLGNTEKLPFIIFSLGHRSARIRTVGNKKPFCMGISLDGTRIESDIYFPFAFD